MPVERRFTGGSLHPELVAALASQCIPDAVAVYRCLMNRGTDFSFERGLRCSLGNGLFLDSLL